MVTIGRFLTRWNLRNFNHYVKSLTLRVRARIPAVQSGDDGEWLGVLKAIVRSVWNRPPEKGSA